MKVRTTGAFLSPRIGKMSERIPAYGRGRVCEAPGCGTLLSTYNPAGSCSVHAAVTSSGPRPLVAVRSVTP